MSYLELSNPTTNSCDYEVYLSSSFNQDNYNELRITSTDYGKSASRISRYVVYKDAPRNGTSRYVRGVVDDGMSPGRRYTLYAYAQAANGIWYLAGEDTISMLDETDSGKEFDYGFRRLEVATAEPYKIGDNIRIVAEVKNHLRTSGPDYVVEMRDKDGKLVYRKYESSLEGKEVKDTIFRPTLESSQAKNNLIKYAFKIKADENGWEEKDPGDNEDTLEITVEPEAVITPEKIDEDANVTGRLSSGEKWYYIEFAKAGNANFFLQPQSSNLDVDLYVYNQDKTTLLAKSRKGSGEDDIIKELAVKARERYYIKIKYIDGSGSFMLRCKNYSSSNAVMEKLKGDTSLGLTEEKKNTLIVMGNVLLKAGFELGFVCGVLGNILHEANVGTFESSNYISNPSAEPPYLQYVDKHFNYRNKFSGKNIKAVGVKATKELVDNCAAVNYQGKFGLGCVQWTGGRTMNLVNCYIDVCGLNAFPTSEQCDKAEGMLISKEFLGAYHAIYQDWLSSYKTSSKAAYEAGSMVCIRYEKPDGYNQKAVTRGNSSQKIYNVLTK